MPITVRKIDSIKTEHKILIVIVALKLSPGLMTLLESHSAGLYVSNTSMMTVGHKNGKTVITSAHTCNRNPASKQVIRGAIIFTEIIEMIAINSANSRLERGRFM